MNTAVLLLLAAIAGIASGVGQYYIPKAYFTIDEIGHESMPVPLRRLKRSLPSLNPVGSFQDNSNIRRFARGLHQTGIKNSPVKLIATPGWQLPPFQALNNKRR